MGDAATWPNSAPHRDRIMQEVDNNDINKRSVTTAGFRIGMHTAEGIEEVREEIPAMLFVTTLEIMTEPLGEAETEEKIVERTGEATKIIDNLDDSIRISATIGIIRMEQTAEC